MAENRKSAAASDAGASATADDGWAPTVEARKKATVLRAIALALWALAIAGEAVGIFWLLRQRVITTEGGLERDPDTGLLQERVAATSFPQWAFIWLLVLLVLIAALSITGSILWKKANRLDPARRSDTARFFVQNQLGAIIAIIAFVPLIVLIFLNKDMDKGQKATAGIVGIVLAAVAAYFGADFTPPSVEQYTADQSAVVQLLGQDEVSWVPGGSVYHVCDEVSDIQTGSEIQTGTTAQAVEEGKGRLTLKLKSELEKCGLPVPENVTDITDALRQIQAGQQVSLPAPVWDEGVTPPLDVEDAAPGS